MRTPLRIGRCAACRDRKVADRFGTFWLVLAASWLAFVAGGVVAAKYVTSGCELVESQTFTQQTKD